MSASYFDRNQNLQIHGDVNFISPDGSLPDGQSLLHVSQRAQVAAPQSGVMSIISSYLIIRWLVDTFAPARIPGPLPVDKSLERASERAIEQGFKILCDNTAPFARYEDGHSFTHPQCHPGTRIAVQDHIFQWFDDKDGPIAMWMNGPVGIGKSAIAQTIAYLAAERGQLSSAFFFFRSDDTRNGPKHLVATLAYEMTHQVPHTLAPVCQTIASNPLIFSSPLYRQINDILLQPCHVLNDSSSTSPKLIVIDGLDECLDLNVQQTIIRSFISSLTSVSSQIISHKLLIVSRPESHIASAFSAVDIRNHVKHLSLESWDTEDDIAIFLRSKLDEIKDTHPRKHHLPSVWPDDASFRNLRRRSVGSFAYASAVARFLASHKHDPERALQDILSAHPHRATAAFTDLDVLYRHILSSLDADIYFTVQKVLCLHLYYDVHSVSFLASGLSEEQSILEIALIHLSSVIYVNNGAIQFHHSSFQEFLLDKGRSGGHYAFSPRVTSAVATALSNLWLRPVYYDNSHWLDIMTLSLEWNTVNVDMELCILRTLAATKLPATIIADDQLQDHKWRAIYRVKEFLLAIQSKSTQSSDSIDRPVYTAAFNVVCVWMRSHFNVHFQGIATLNNILDIIVDITDYRMTVREDLWLYSFGHFARKDREPIDFLCRLFPEMDCVEVCAGIMDRYLSIPLESRLACRSETFGTSASPASLTELYVIALGHQDAMTASLCQHVEQLVFDRRNTLRGTLGQYTSSKLYILRMLYGPTCNMDSRLDLPYFEFGTYQRHVHQPLWKELVEKTDDYIRQVHAKLDFPYISTDVETLYRSEPVDF